MLTNAEHSGGEERHPKLMSVVQIGKAPGGSRQAILPSLLVLDDGLAKQEFRVPSCYCKAPPLAVPASDDISPHLDANQLLGSHSCSFFFQLQGLELVCESSPPSNPSGRPT
jgi:hypothetical protein